MGLAHEICVHARENLTPAQPSQCGDPNCLGPAKLGVSIGVTVFDDMMSAEQLVQSAEKKVMHAKWAGGDQFCM